MARVPDGPESNDPLDSEVTSKARQRRFTAEYELRMLREADALSESDSVGEMLRREGLDSSHLAKRGAPRGRQASLPVSLRRSAAANRRPAVRLLTRIGGSRG